MKYLQHITMFEYQDDLCLPDEQQHAIKSKKKKYLTFFANVAFSRGQQLLLSFQGSCVNSFSQNIGIQS